MDYERNPKRIYEQSFALIEEALGAAGPIGLQRDLAIRLVHACGMPDIVGDLRISDGLEAAARGALAARAPIFCDAQMVAHGIIARALPQGMSPRVSLNDPEVPDIAARLGTTRSAAAVELWRDDLEGSIIVIGNAPTALFHLLEGLEAGWPKPALILGFPVGFVGAAESKEALAMLPHGVPYATLLGRRGGSAMAAAAMNALTLGLNGDGT